MKDVKRKYDYSYVELEDDTIEIVNYEGEDSEIEIPSEIDGKKVSKIGNFSFEEKNLTSVKIPDTVKEIEMSAFTTNKLKEVEIPDSVEKIGMNSFSNNKIEKLDLGKGVKEIESVAFADNKLKEVHLPKSIEKIETGAFADNEIETVYYEKGIEADIHPLTFKGNNVKRVIEVEEKEVEKKHNRLVLPIKAKAKEDKFEQELKNVAKGKYSERYYEENEDQLLTKSKREFRSEVFNNYEPKEEKKEFEERIERKMNKEEEKKFEKTLKNNIVDGFDYAKDKHLAKQKWKEVSWNTNRKADQIKDPQYYKENEHRLDWEGVAKKHKITPQVYESNKYYLRDKHEELERNELTDMRYLGGYMEREEDKDKQRGLSF